MEKPPINPVLTVGIGPLNAVIQGRWSGAMPGNIDSRAIRRPEHQAKAGFPRLHAKSGQFRRVKVAPFHTGSRHRRFRHTLDLGQANFASERQSVHQVAELRS